MKTKEYRKAYKERKPWASHYNNARSRCVYPNKNYKGKNIKFLLFMEDFKFMWIRDGAMLMLKPSIHRIDGPGNFIWKYA